MSEETVQTERIRSPREELLNCVSHAIGLVLAMAGTWVMLSSARNRGGAFRMTGAAVFGVTMMLTYLISTLYHGLRSERAKRMLLTLDYAAIFIFIAGTYTPYALCAMDRKWGLTILSLIWGLAGAGILMKLIFGPRCRNVGIALYLGMGWLSVVALYAMWGHVQRGGIACLFMGVIVYSAGVLYFINDHRKHNHLRWHLFVMFGTLFHFVSIWGYVI